MQRLTITEYLEEGAFNTILADGSPSFLRLPTSLCATWRRKLLDAGGPILVDVKATRQSLGHYILAIEEVVPVTFTEAQLEEYLKQEQENIAAAVRLSFSRFKTYMERRNG